MTVANLDSSLIEAVEAGRHFDVERLIDNGASPDARKRITLKARVTNGLFSNEWKRDVFDGETALCLAVLHAQSSVVKTLLEKGTRVRGPLEWRISNWWDRTWTSDEWERKRCHRTYTFPSILCLAIGRGGMVKWWNGSGETCPASDGRLDINLKGSMVTLSHPTTGEEARVWFKVQPRVDIVRLLLAFGAPVTKEELDAARQNPDPDFLSILKAHLQTTIPRPHDTPEPPSRSASPPPTNNLVVTLRQENASLLNQNTILRHEISALRSQNATLIAENAALRSQLPSPPQNPSLSAPPTSVHQMMFANADYVPQRDDEIGFARGDGVFVNLAYTDGWCSGFHTTTQAVGCFPLSYLRSSDSMASFAATQTTVVPIPTRTESLPQPVTSDSREPPPYSSASNGTTDSASPQTSAPAAPSLLGLLSNHSERLLEPSFGPSEVVAAVVGGLETHE